MTTTNNHLMLIEKVGGIEKAKGIVEGAPEGATIISLATLEYFRELVNPLYENEPYRFLRIQITEDGLLRHSTRFAPIISPINLNDLRTAIEHHYYGRSEAEELAAYAELSQEKIEGGAMLVGDFSEARKIIDKQLESDQITDIRNHISPRTVVWDLASGEDWSVNHG